MSKRMVLLTLFLAGAAGAAGATGAPRRTPEVLAKGKAAFNTYCASCHGESGVGDGAAAAALASKPRNFRKDTFKQGAKVTQVFDTIGKGVANTPMAPFAYLAEDDRWALSYWVLELKAGKK